MNVNLSGSLRERRKCFRMQNHLACPLQRQSVHLLLHLRLLLLLLLLSLLLLLFYLLTIFMFFFVHFALALQVVQQRTVLLQLGLETVVRTHHFSLAADVFQSLTETHPLPSHEKDDDEGGGLTINLLTREMPAAQWTSTLPLFSPSRINW